MDSIIFDLDGTLWDATDTLAKPWTATLNKNGINKQLTASDLTHIMGMTVPQIAEFFMPDVNCAERLRIAYEACEAEIPYLKQYGGTLYPDLEQTLKELSKTYKLFIVSNCEDDYIKAFYEFHGLKKYITDEEYIGRTAKKKSENIKLIIKRHNLKAPVYVGDTIMDYEAASKNSLPFIFASYGFGECETYTDKLTKIADLPDVMNRLK